MSTIVYAGILPNVGVPPPAGRDALVRNCQCGNGYRDRLTVRQDHSSPIDSVNQEQLHTPHHPITARVSTQARHATSGTQ
ncbi:hypothetical protein HaLaN_29770 [Haematococcus lacustris]|uniref:Uncharacterized protein n=1 Tax=Haematococcus lacustris TaxID=44745 RepID=A0A6A0AEU4_HAELA|nr:hypothetical protein HaLaN_29770 [Haematococcus lacustris]